METIAPWADYGLAGLVIFALFWGIKNLFTIGIEKIDNMMERCHEDSKSLRLEHQNERAEWREVQERREDKMDTTIIGLTTAIDRQTDRRRGSD